MTFSNPVELVVLVDTAQRLLATPLVAATRTELQAVASQVVGAVSPDDHDLYRDVVDGLEARQQGLERDRRTSSNGKPVRTTDKPDRAPEPLAIVLADTEAFIRRFVVAADPAAFPFLALWVAHTWTVEAVDTTPYIHISAPEKRSGKTRLLEVLSVLVREPMVAADISTAALYRQVQEKQPTLLMDEVDGLFGRAGRVDPENRDKVRLLNAGWQRGAKVYRMGGPKGNVSEEFEAFCPKVLCGIGELPDTLGDRSVRVNMKRRSHSESVERFRRRDVLPESTVLRERLEAATGPHADALSTARPDDVPGLDDRATDAWEPILALAERAGGDWLERAHAAAASLSANREPEDDTIGVRLLADIRSVFGDRDRMATIPLVDALNALDEAPWGDLWGRPLTDRTLAKMLRPYGVRPKVVRLDDGSTPRGYLRESFVDAWERYVDPHKRGDEDLPQTSPTLSTAPLSATSATSQQGRAETPISRAQQTFDVALSKTPENSTRTPDVALVAAKRAEERESGAGWAAEKSHVEPGEDALAAAGLFDPADDGYDAETDRIAGL